MLMMAGCDGYHMLGAIAGAAFASEIASETDCCG